MPAHTSSPRAKTAPLPSPPSQHTRSSSSSSSRKFSPTHSAPAKASSQKIPREFQWAPDCPGNGMVLSYNDQHSFIIKPDDWETAVDLAIREFRELQQIERSRITLEKRCAVGEDMVLVRITPEAWKSVVAPLVQWEVIEVRVAEVEEPEVIDPPVTIKRKRSRSILGRLFDRSPCSSRPGSPSGSQSSSRSHSPDRPSSLPTPHTSARGPVSVMKTHVQEPRDKNLLSPHWVLPPPPSSRRSKTP